jgi:hypothetical protein
MATLSTKTVLKLQRHRGLYSGKFQSVTGSYLCKAGTSIALTDVIRAVTLGNNIRPLRLTLSFVPTSGNPALTNATFNVGVEGATSSAFLDPKGNSFAVPATNASVLSAALAIDADNMATDVEVPAPVAASVSNYAPFYVTLTPAGAGAFSVAGGDGMLNLTVEFLGLEDRAEPVYTDYVNQKVKN